ncbi:hypothetical protein VP395_06050 [Mariniflexile soesokkakense]|uniref:DUF7793 domain-containing protein n=1 Tax=Mariniflexile soesokkakense TaxID=1343160 RepID=A0ABV0ABF3_9FLAO
MDENKNVIQMEHSKFWIDKGVLFCEICNPDQTRNLNEETVESYLKAVSILCKGEKMPFLIDLRNTHGTFLNSAAKKLANSPELSKLSLSEAFVVNSLKVKLLIISYKRIYEPITPFKIFNNYNEALMYSINVKNTINGTS